MHTIKLITALIWMWAAAANATTVYVYVGPKGDRLITDHLRPELGAYKLVKKYSADDYFGSPNRPIRPVLVQPRLSEFDDLIRRKAIQFGLEPALLKAMVHIESAFNPVAISPKGATGLMQLMPAVAQRYGVLRRTDPVESIDGGGRYFRDLLFRFGHDTRLALAAYNAGENAVTKYNGIPPYPETKAYVKKVMKLRDLYRKRLIGA